MVLSEYCNCLTAEQEEVIIYLKDNGYLQSLQFSKSEFKKAVRSCQRENNLNVNGRVTQEFKDFVKYENNKSMVVDYLKKYNYIANTANPIAIQEGVKKLQRNSGVLTVNGIIDTHTINFIKNNPIGYSEMLFEP